MDVSLGNTSLTEVERIGDYGVEISSIAIAAMLLIYILYHIGLWIYYTKNKCDQIRYIIKYRTEYVFILTILFVTIIEIILRTFFPIYVDIHKYNHLSSFVVVVAMIGLLHFKIRPQSEFKLQTIFMFLFWLCVAVREGFYAYGLFEAEYIERSKNHIGIAIGMGIPIVIRTGCFLVALFFLVMMLIKAREKKEIHVLDPCPSEATEKFFEALAQLLAKRKIITKKITIEDYNAKQVSKYAVVICNCHTRLENDAVEAKAKLKLDLDKYILFTVVHFVISHKHCDWIPAKKFVVECDLQFKKCFDVVDILFFYRESSDQIGECNTNDKTLEIIEDFAGRN